MVVFLEKYLEKYYKDSLLSFLEKIQKESRKFNLAEFEPVIGIQIQPFLCLVFGMGSF